MVLSIDTSRALRTPDQVLSLIQAVFEAAPEDESRSIEWKSAYTDLTSTESSFAISRAILGLANRPVAVAAASFEGVGYVLVGVEPGSLEGQQVPDSAELLNAIHRYTGHGWPYWDARTLTFNDVTVLVVTVEPPRDGDRIALLQKSYQAPKGSMVSEGTIFVRRPGATERASRAEVEMLQDRLLSGSEAEGAALREATRKRELRDIVTDLVQAGNRWADTMQILVMSSTGNEWKQRDWIEWVDTDSGREMTQNAQSVDRNIRKLRLHTGEDSLILPAMEAQQRIQGGKAFAVLHSNSRGSEDDRVSAYQEINAIKSDLAKLELAAIRLLTASRS
ncbi:RNA-binding domain-containing protein [Arthrobacter sp. UYCu712]|uniref:AlbA family DNA-binding domain-containing protein n=1 Tax=Arthrobacter sp. UYCu712 TaxID=3156340 RepID=UPI003397C1CB